MVEKESISDILKLGGEIAGAAVGGALGFLAGGPTTAAGAAIVGLAAEKLLADVAVRQLSRREQIRIGAVASLAIAEIQAILGRGQGPRQDGFFDPIHGGRSSAEELFEGVLLKSKNEHEEKKLHLFGHLFAVVCFAPGISPGEANLILKDLQELTYWHLCTLSIIFQKDPRGYKLRPSDYRGLRAPLQFDLLAILQTIYDLYNRGLVYCRGTTEQTASEALLGATDVAPARMQVTGRGKRFGIAVNIATIPTDDLDPLVKLLSD